MLILVIATLLLCLIIQPTLSSSISEIAKPFHEACQLAAPLGSHRELYQAIVCGVELKQSSFKEALKASGLIHLMVVSGSHLVFLTSSIEFTVDRATATNDSRSSMTKSNGATALIIVGLLVFALACRFQAPIARAWFYVLLANGDRVWRLRWTSLQRITLSSLLTLPLCADSYDLQSLLLSWTASLAIHFRTPLESSSERPLTHFLREARTYLILLPALWPLGAPHPASIVTQVIMAPVLGGFLFPGAIIAMILPPLAPVVDVLWDALIWACMEFARRIPAGWPRLSSTPAFLWGYVLVLTCIFEWSRHSKRSRK